MATPIDQIKADIESAEKAIQAHGDNIQRSEKMILILRGALEANRKMLATLETWRPDEPPTVEA